MLRKFEWYGKGKTHTQQAIHKFVFVQESRKYIFFFLTKNLVPRIFLVEMVKMIDGFSELNFIGFYG